MDCWIWLLFRFVFTLTFYKPAKRRKQEVLLIVILHHQDQHGEIKFCWLTQVYDFNDSHLYIYALLSHREINEKNEWQYSNNSIIRLHINCMLWIMTNRYRQNQNKASCPIMIQDLFLFNVWLDEVTKSTEEDKSTAAFTGFHLFINTVLMSPWLPNDFNHLYMDYTDQW